GAADENGTWHLSVLISTGACSYILTNTLQINGCIGDPLPVKYNYVRAVYQNCQLSVQWSTSQQENTERFEIETSSNGTTDWQKVNTTATTGLSSSEQKYNADIPRGNASLLYMRIKQVDKDGRFAYSTILKTDLSCDDNIDKLSANPNPVLQNGSVVVKIQSSISRGKSSMILTDITGRQYLNKSVTLNKVLNRYDLPVTGLSKGTYFLRIAIADGSWRSNTVKILVQ
ncbi:MAG: T9SS type A sorting domain-containing protein, partial [Bacteroidota bacterium]